LPATDMFRYRRPFRSRPASAEALRKCDWPRHTESSHPRAGGSIRTLDPGAFFYLVRIRPRTSQKIIPTVLTQMTMVNL
jgi:hypothetical protein